LFLEREVERLPHTGSGSNRAKLKEHEVELKRRNVVYADDAHLRETETRRTELENDRQGSKKELETKLESG